MVSAPSFCLFRCGTLALAVAVEDVAEIVETDSIVRISGCPPRIAGLCPYHRQVVPVVSLEPRPAGHRECGAVLILRTSHGPWGIRIDRDGTVISSARPSRHEPTEGGGFVSIGTIREGTADFALLDPGATWRALRDVIVNWYADTGEAPSGSSSHQREVAS